MHVKAGFWTGLDYIIYGLGFGLDFGRNMYCMLLCHNACLLLAVGRCKLNGVLECNG